MEPTDQQPACAALPGVDQGVNLTEQALTDADRAAMHPVVTAPRAWDPATATDPWDDMRALAERARRGDLPDKTAERVAAEAAAIDRAFGGVELAPVVPFGPVGPETAQVMLWCAVEALADAPDAEERIRAMAADRLHRMANRVRAVQRAAEHFQGNEQMLAQLDEQRERLKVEAALDERAVAQLLTVAREVAGWSPAVREERQMLASMHQAAAPVGYSNELGRLRVVGSAHPERRMEAPEALGAWRPTAAQLAEAFHEIYEELAPSFGYQTREASAKPWAEVPEANRRLMTATCGAVLLRLFGPSGLDGDAGGARADVGE